MKAFFPSPANFFRRLSPPSHGSGSKVGPPLEPCSENSKKPWQKQLPRKSHGNCLTPGIFAALGALGLGVGISAHANPDPTVAGPLTPLRKAPVFESESVYLSKNWGPAIPVGRPFRVEKVYGRWIYGTPEPLPKMRPEEFASAGWVFSRFLLRPGDSDTQEPSVRKITEGILYHSQKTWQQLGKEKDPQLLAWNFYENLILSKGALKQFQDQDQRTAEILRENFFPATFPQLSFAMLPERPTSLPISLPFSLLPSAVANEKPETVGLTGTDLGFLDQEFQVVQEQKRIQQQKREALKLKPPGAPALTKDVQLGLLGRYMASQHFLLPPLNHEEVDGFFYMKAVAHRALSGCPVKVKNYWKNKHWNFFRFYRSKNLTVAYPWQEITLPGGYFGISAKALDQTSDESELAFLLVRQLVRESRLKFPKITFPTKNWWTLLPEKSAEILEGRWKSQSGKFSDNLDVSDEIQIDLIAAECLANSGYQPQSAHVFLRKMFLQREEKWAEWYFQQSIGFEYRTEQMVQRIKKEMDLKKWNPDGVRNQKRFASVLKQWNLMP